jgi:conjugal transfer pilus assembly protein TraL
MSGPITIPRHLDDPELIGLWTIDEMVAMIIPFVWGILSQHIIIGLILAVAAWWALRKAKGNRSSRWLYQAGYWYLPGRLLGLKATPPSYCRRLAG